LTLNIIESPVPTQGELAYRTLRRMIVDCEFAPGSSVSEPELTQLVGQGKAAVRSALLRLSHDGLITAVPRFGYRIAPLDIKDALELTQLRLLTEPSAIRLATGRLDPMVIQLARKRYAAGYDWKNPKAVTRYLTYSREFKLAFARASGNGRLALWIEEVSEQIDRYLRIGAMSSSELPPTIAAHLLPVCDAMLDGRAEDAEVLATENILAVTARILSALFRPHERASEFAFTGADIASMLGLKRKGPISPVGPEPRARKAA
jgi:DNA-binding GntR family transcriptional regulator